MEIIKATTPNSNRIDQMRQCPRFEKCNAPICPLDPDWNKRILLSDEPTCFYLTEAVKPNAKAIFEHRGCGELFRLVSEVIDAMSVQWSRIRFQLEQARRSGSRLGRVAPWEKS